MQDYIEELKKRLKVKYEEVAELEIDEPGLSGEDLAVYVNGIVNRHGPVIRKVTLRILTALNGINRGNVVALIENEGNAYEFPIDKYNPDFIVTFLGSRLGEIAYKLVPVEAKNND